jgi:type IV secretory pathway TrbL component
MGLLDQLVNVFLTVLTVGTGNLSAEAQFLLRIFIGIEVVTAAAFWFWAGEQIGSLLAFKAVRIGLFGFFVLQWLFLTSLFRDSMLWVASQIGGGVITVDTFLHPSALASSGYVATEPIWKWLQNTTGAAAIWNIGTTILFVIALHGIWLAYNLTAINMSICLIIFQFLAAFLLIFIAFGVFTGTNFLAERALGGVISSSIRMGLVAACVSLAYPIVQFFILPDPNAGIDPSMRQAFMLMAAVWAMFLISLVVPSIGATLFEGGPVLSGWGLIGGGLRAGATTSRVVFGTADMIVTGISNLRKP